MNLSERLKSIKERWLSIKENDPKCLAPGSMFHNYYLDEENVSRKNIENFEANNGFTLPEEYKEYLIQVTNGGVGPYNVMYPLHDALYPLNRGSKEDENYHDWLEENLDHYVSDFPVTEEQIIAWLTFKINHATTETPPIVIGYNDPGYLFLCTVEPGKHYIMPVNGACVNEVWLMKEAKRVNESGNEEPCFNLWPEVRFVEDQIKTLSFLEWIEDAQQNWFSTNTSLAHRLSAVKTTWFNLAAHDRGEGVFGAFIHHYQMNEALSEEQVADFAKQYNFVLPEEYKEYLKLVSNGGVGPFYGMYSLEDSVIAHNSGLIDDGSFINYLEKNPDHFSKTFPVTDEEVNNYLLKKISDPSANLDPIKLDINAGGYLFIAEYGCGGYFIMPVNGNSAGEIWYLKKINADKLTYEMTDADGNVTMSGSYGAHREENYFELYPELKWNNEQSSTVNFLEWIEYKQSTWFAESAGEKEEEEVDNDDNDQSSGFGDLDNENAYHPLAIGNTWTHEFYGQDMITAIESVNEAGEFVVSNSLNTEKGLMKKVGNQYFALALDKSGFNLMLKDDMALADTWQYKFKAPSGLDTIYIHTVKEILSSKTVGEVEYKDVVMVELDSLYEINGVAISLNSFTQTYYAKGVGVILTTSSGVVGNSSSPLKSYELK